MFSIFLTNEYRKELVASFDAIEDALDYANTTMKAIYIEEDEDCPGFYDFVANFRGICVPYSIEITG